MDRDFLIQQAGSKYDSSMTVVKAKALRMKPAETQSQEEQQQEEIKKQQEEIKTDISTNKFTLPDDTDKIDQIITIIQTHSGTEKISINNKEIAINEQGIQKIRDLLAL
jgi:ribosomal protein L9